MIFLAFAGGSSALCETAAGRSIPLKEVWALDTPGTQAMNAALNVAADGFLAPEGPLVAEIVETLNYPDRLSPAVRDLLGDTNYGALAVAGRKMDALRNAHAVLVGGKVPQDSFAADETLSVFFFTMAMPQFVHLAEVSQDRGDVQLKYRLVPHKSKQTTVHVALVPIANPGAADVRVVIEPITKHNIR